MHEKRVPRFFNLSLPALTLLLNPETVAPYEQRAPVILTTETPLPTVLFKRVTLWVTSMVQSPQLRSCPATLGSL